MKTLQELKKDISENPSLATQINGNTIEAILAALQKAGYATTRDELQNEVKMCAEGGEGCVNGWILAAEIFVVG